MKEVCLKFPVLDTHSKATNHLHVYCHLAASSCCFLFLLRKNSFESFFLNLQGMIAYVGLWRYIKAKGNNPEEAKTSETKTVLHYQFLEFIMKWNLKQFLPSSFIYDFAIHLHVSFFLLKKSPTINFFKLFFDQLLVKMEKHANYIFWKRESLKIIGQFTEVLKTGIILLYYC